MPCCPMSPPTFSNMQTTGVHKQPPQRHYTRDSARQLLSKPQSKPHSWSYTLRRPASQTQTEAGYGTVCLQAVHTAHWLHCVTVGLQQNGEEWHLAEGDAERPLSRHEGWYTNTRICIILAPAWMDVRSHALPQGASDEQPLIKNCLRVPSPALARAPFSRAPSHTPLFHTRYDSLTLPPSDDLRKPT